MQPCHLPAGHCLLDKPSEWLRLPTALPGAAYPLERQCQLAFGTDSRHCGELQPPCAALWCSGRAGGRAVCQTKHFPWADGTPCGPGRACVSGQCVGIAAVEELNVSAATLRVGFGYHRRWSDGLVVPSQNPVDGAWGPWGPWGGCSRSCGGGVSFSQRSCSRPAPRNGGRYCRGERSRFRSCNTGACPGSNREWGPRWGRTGRVLGAALVLTVPRVPPPRSPGFSGGAVCRLQPSPRHLQGAAGGRGLGAALQRGRREGSVQADLPVAHPGLLPRAGATGERPRPASLFPVGVAPRGAEAVLCVPQVADGTPCSPEGTGVCVRGRCVPTGCDRVIGSKKKFDKCMVCGGDGSACTKVSGVFTKPR